MPKPFPYEQLSESTKAWKDGLDGQRLMPRARMALRMYAHGAVNSLTEAAEIMGLSVGYLSGVHNSQPGQAFMESCEQILQNKALEGTQLLDQLGRRAIEIIAKHAEHSASDKVSLDAAKDLADRSTAYSKVQRVDLQAITLQGKDVKALAEALVRGPLVHEKYKELANGDFNRIEGLTDVQPPSDSKPTDS